MSQATKHRQRIKKTLQDNTYEHQQLAAECAFSNFKSGSKAVVLVAEMQSGKSGIALALGSYQRNSLNDVDICDYNQLNDTLYLVTLSDLALLEQAKKDLAPAINVVVSNFTNFETALLRDFKSQPPKLIIIDECHYGATSEAIRYSKVFNYLEKESVNCNVVFISATPFSALYSAGSDSILRHKFQTSLVFHKTSAEYHGIRQMHKNNQIVKLTDEQRNFCDNSLLRKRFIRQFKEHDGAGWSLVRVPSSQANEAKQILLDNGLQDKQIVIIGQRLVDVDDSDLVSIDDFKRSYDTASLFGEKMIAITVAGFRAGINFGHEMKATLINTWDSTIANIAAIVQANIGRACGYHQNIHAKHYTNLDAVRAYSELLEHLESKDDSSEFEGLHQVFEQICTKFNVRGFDRGTTIAPVTEYKVTKKLDDSKAYLTKGYIVVPGKLDDPDFDYSSYTKEPDLLNAIALIRQEFLDDDGPYRKKGRALRGEHQNWIKAQWVNGATYDDGTPSCAKSRAIAFTTRINANEPVEFNQIVNPGGGEKTEDKRIMASIFSIFNLSGQMDALKRAMDRDDMEEICDMFSIEHDDTLILLYQRGEFSTELTDKKSQASTEIKATRIRNKSVF